MRSVVLARGPIEYHHDKEAQDSQIPDPCTKNDPWASFVPSSAASTGSSNSKPDAMHTNRGEQTRKQLHEQRNQIVDIQAQLNCIVIRLQLIKNSHTLVLMSKRSFKFQTVRHELATQVSEVKMSFQATLQSALDSNAKQLQGSLSSEFEAIKQLLRQPEADKRHKSSSQSRASRDQFDPSWPHSFFTFGSPVQTHFLQKPGRM